MNRESAGPAGRSVDLEQARRLLREGRADEAEKAFARLLELEPDHCEALNMVAMAALRRGQIPRCLELLRRAAALAPGEPLTHNNLGLAHESAGDLAAALVAYSQALVCNPELDITRLQQGKVLERLGRHEQAVPAYLRAIRSAQNKGRWLNAATTAPGIRPLVEHAIHYASERRRQLLGRLLDEQRSRHGPDALKRVEQCLEIYLGARADRPDPCQQPTFLFFPGLPAQIYLDRALFPWIAGYEGGTAAIREELLGVLPHAAGREPVFHDAKLEQANLRGAAPRWDGYYFYRHGQRNEINCRNCPRTFEALEALPLARVRGNAPEAMFSVLAAGTHLLPHRGVTNTRLVVHLPLIVPRDCALRVGGELHEWREGRVVVFDDTYEHEAWNRSAETRVVLIADIWNPYLSEAERFALAEMAAAIGDIGRVDAGIPA